MARKVSRDDLISIANGINSDVEELGGYLNEAKALEADFAQAWKDTGESTKSDDCLAYIQQIEKVISNSMTLSQGVASIYLEDTHIGGDF